MTLEKFFERLPDTIKIGPWSWRLVVTEQMSIEKEGELPNLGEAEERTHTIRLHPKHADASHALSTLWHEIYHAALSSFGQNHPKKEEEGALAFETIISSVSQDNLWLIDLMKKVYR